MLLFTRGLLFIFLNAQEALVSIYIYIYIFIYLFIYLYKNANAGEIISIQTLTNTSVTKFCILNFIATMFLTTFTTPTIRIVHIKANKQTEKPRKQSN